MSKLFKSSKGIVNVNKTALPVVKKNPDSKMVSAEQIAQVSSVPASEIKTAEKLSGGTVAAKPVLTDMNQKVKKIISLKV